MMQDSRRQHVIKGEFAVKYMRSRPNAHAALRAAPFGFAMACFSLLCLCDTDEVPKPDIWLGLPQARLGEDRVPRVYKTGHLSH